MTDAHAHRLAPRDHPIDFLIATPSESIHKEVIRPFPILAAKLNLSAPAVTSDAMNEVILALVDISMKPLVLKHIQIRSTQDLIYAAHAPIDETIRALRSLPASVQTDVGTMSHHHFSNFVVSSLGSHPVLCYAVFRGTLTQTDDSSLTTSMVTDLLQQSVSKVRSGSPG
jgi:hypothetical protein